MRVSVSSGLISVIRLTPSARLHRELVQALAVVLDFEPHLTGVDLDLAGVRSRSVSDTSTVLSSPKTSSSLPALSAVALPAPSSATRPV